MAIAIVPAAGRARRMGRSKLHLPYGSTTILGATVDALRGGGAGEILLVLAPSDARTPAWATARGVRFTVNPHPTDDGMLRSIWTALAALGGAAAVAARGLPLLVCPADLPRLRAVTVASLLAERQRLDAALLVPAFRGRRGHPLVVAPRLIAEIPTLDPGIGLRQLRARHAAAAVTVELDDPGVVLDVDTPRDYGELPPPV